MASDNQSSNSILASKEIISRILREYETFSVNSV